MEINIIGYVGSNRKLKIEDKVKLGVDVEQIYKTAGQAQRIGEFVYKVKYIINNDEDMIDLLNWVNRGDTAPFYLTVLERMA